MNDSSSSTLTSAKTAAIYSAAVQVFAEKGYANTTVQDIARAAGVGKGTIYQYVKSKEDLFYEVFLWINRETGAKLRVGIEALGGSPVARLTALNRTVIDAVIAMKPLYGLFMDFWSASATPALRERFKAAFREFYSDYRGIVAAVIKQGVATGVFRNDLDIEAVCAALVGMWDALGLQAWFDDDFRMDHAGNEFMRVFINGLAAP
jgi:AcrR family transcriptional regulator